MLSFSFYSLDYGCKLQILERFGLKCPPVGAVLRLYSQVTCVVLTENGLFHTRFTSVSAQPDIIRRIMQFRGIPNFF